MLRDCGNGKMRIYTNRVAIGHLATEFTVKKISTMDCSLVVNGIITMIQKISALWYDSF